LQLAAHRNTCRQCHGNISTIFKHVVRRAVPVQAGASPAASNAVGITPLLAASGHGQAGCLQLLHRHCGPAAWQTLLAAKDCYGRTALHFAAASGGDLADLIDCLLGRRCWGDWLRFNLTAGMRVSCQS
jgi:ankyrin repeat protein